MNVPDIYTAVRDTNDLVRLKLESCFFKLDLPEHLLLTHQGLDASLKLLIAAQEGELLLRLGQVTREKDSIIRDMISEAKFLFEPLDYDELFNSSTRSEEVSVKVLSKKFRSIMKETRDEYSRLSFSNWVVSISLGTLNKLGKVTYSSLSTSLGNPTQSKQNDGLADEKTVWTSRLELEAQYNQMSRLIAAGALVKYDSENFQEILEFGHFLYTTQLLLESLNSQLH
jgi:hypothetical protein